MLAMKRVIGGAPSFVPRCDVLNEYLVKLRGVAVARDFERRCSIGALPLSNCASVYAPSVAPSVSAATAAC